MYDTLLTEKQIEKALKSKPNEVVAPALTPIGLVWLKLVAKAQAQKTYPIAYKHGQKLVAKAQAQKTYPIAYKHGQKDLMERIELILRGYSLSSNLEAELESLRKEILG